MKKAFIMKNYMLLTLLLCVSFVTLPACNKKSDASPQCQNITLNKSFLAKIGEEWCIPANDWSIKFGPFVEDSRCNVVNVECVWAGRFVMDATINNGEPVPHTFEAVNNWSDTIYSGIYTIILQKVYPEIRVNTEPLDPSAYSFDVLVK
jgi:hypothetical protein